VLTCGRCGQENPDGFRFCGACAAPLTQEAPEAREERRIVTVLFSDLVGFTARVERLDPEDVRRSSPRTMRAFALSWSAMAARSRSSSVTR